MDKQNAPKASRRRKLLTVLCVILSIILLALVFVCIYVDRLLDRINRYTEPSETLSSSEIHEIENQTDAQEDLTSPTIDPEDVTWSTEPAQSLESEGKINILLIGQDRREGEGRQRSDAMILCTIDKTDKTLTMTSFLRDLYVQIPGYQDNRINAAYQFGGMPLLDETLELNFAVHIDGNVEVDFSGFKQIVELVGGVDINLTSAEARHLNKVYGMALHEGVNHLDGEQALAYSRIRYLGTDFGRTNRQRTVLQAMLSQCKNLSLGELNTLLHTMLGLITTDMTDAEILGYAVELFPLLKNLQVETQYIPAEGEFQFATIRGMSVLLPDLEANRQILKETIGDE